jgi:hypothetical protein
MVETAAVLVETAAVLVEIAVTSCWLPDFQAGARLVSQPPSPGAGPLPVMKDSLHPIPLGNHTNLCFLLLVRQLRLPKLSKP